MGEMKDRMLRGELYIADDPEIQADAARAHALHGALQRDARRPSRTLRDRLLRELLGEVGEGVVVRPPFWSTTARTSRSARGRSSTTTA